MFLNKIFIYKINNMRIVILFLVCLAMGIGAATAQTVTATSNAMPANGTTGTLYVGSGTLATPINKASIGGSLKLFNTGVNGINSPSLYLWNTTATTGRNYYLNTDNLGNFRIIDSNAANAVRFHISGVASTLGFVGIGTGSPLAQLHTTGTMRFDKFKNNAAGDSLLTTDVNGNLIFKKVAIPATVDSSKWTLSGTNIFSKNTGNVGIGTNAPGAKLSINSGTAGVSGLQFTQLNSGTAAALTGGKVLALDAGGNVIQQALGGLGQKNAINNADWVGTALAPNNGGTGLTALGTATQQLRVNAAGTALEYFTPAAGTTGWGLTGNTGTTTANFLGTADNNSLRLRTNNLQRMILDSTGNVGIGVTNPLGKLETPHLRLTSTAGNNPLIQGLFNGLVLESVQAGSALQLRTNDGYVNIVGGATKGGELRLNTSGNTERFRLTADGNLNVFDAQPMTFSTNNTERLRIDAVGNMGIGISNPIAQLHTNGTVRFDKFKNNATLDSLLTTDVSGNLIFKKVTVPAAVDSSKWSLNGANIFSKNTGNVGIGTNTPSQKLDVAGKIKASDDIYANGANGLVLYDLDPANYNISRVGTQVLIKSAGDLSINAGVGPILGKINNVEKFRIAADGNVGIGVNAPLAQLHTNGTVRFDKYKNNAAGDSVLTTDATGNLVLRKLAIPAATDSSKWSLSGTNIFSKNTGNVGIGTTAPAYKLDVNGNALISGDVILSGNGSTNGVRFTTANSFDQLLSYTNNSGLRIEALNGPVNIGGKAATGGPVTNVTMNRQLRIYTDNDGLDGLILQPNSINTAARLGTTELTIGANQIDVIKISSAGNVGIGTITPSAKLHTTGTVRFENYKNNAAGDSVLTTDANGNLKLKALTALPAGWGLTGNNGTTVANFLGTVDNNSLRFRTNNLQRMVLDSNGNVGIGVSNPTEKLTIAGNNKILFTPVSVQNQTSSIGTDIYDNLAINVGMNLGKSIAFGDLSSSWIARFAANGASFRSNVGIGIENPVVQLHTNGAVRFENYKNNAAGDSVLTTDANGNLMLKALTAPSTGWSLAGNNIYNNNIGNVGIGNTNPAYKFDLTGTARIKAATNSNTPFLIIDDSTSGLRALEMRAYWEPIVSSASIYIGDSSGVSTVHNNAYSSVNNTSIGSKSFSKLTSGGWNTAIGQSALSSLTTGNFNTALGQGSLRALVTGDDNTAIGQASMVFKTSGFGNTGIGSNSLQYSNGNENTAIGKGALGNSASGSNNTALGRSAGRDISGDNNVFIGRFAGYNAGTINNRLYIDNDGTDAKQPLLYGEFDNSFLKINGKAQVTDTLSITTMSNTDSSDRAASTAWVKRQAFGTGNSVWTSDGNNIYSNNTGSAGIGKIPLAGLKLDVNGPSSFSRFGTPGTFNANLPGEVFVTHPANNWGLVITRAMNDNGNANLTFYKTRSTDASVKAAVVSGDNMGRLTFQGVAGDNATVAVGSQLMSTAELVSPAYISSNFKFFTTNTAGSFAERARITADGNLLLGIAADNGKKLQVNGSGYVKDTLMIGVDTATAQLHTRGSIRFELFKNSQQGDSVLTTDENGNLKLKALTGLSGGNDISKWLLRNKTIYSKDSLNVGIGVDSATAKLHVKGDVRFENLKNSQSLDSVLSTDQNGNLVMAYRPYGTGTGGGAVYNFGNGVQQIDGNVTLGGVLQDSVKINLNEQHAFHFNNGANRVLSMSAAGNVGIGTTGPASGYKLLVNGDAGIGNQMDTVGSGDKLKFNGNGNADPLFVQRTNTAPNASELRVNIGDDGVATDKFNVGYYPAIGPWKSNFAVQANGQVGIGTAEINSELSVGTQHGTKLSIGNAQWGQSSIITTGTDSRGDYTDIKVPGSAFNNSFIRMSSNGNVGIGTIALDTPYVLAVNGKIRSKGLRVETGNWADFVFEPGYKMKSLNELEKFIEKNKHLPEMPTTADVQKNGQDVGEVQVKLLQKIEELTLYVIEQNKKISALEEKNKKQEDTDKEINDLKKQLEELKNLVLKNK
jgi:hypothetical protein